MLPCTRKGSHISQLPHWHATRRSQMYLYVFFILAAALAIPTWGISLLVFWWLKRAYDKRTVSAILAKAAISMQEVDGEELFHVNHAAVAKVFKDHEIAGTGEGMNVGGVWLRWGVLTHPMIDQGRSFSLRLINQPRGQTTIHAAPGRDSQVLSDHLEGIGSFRLAAMGVLAGETPDK